MNRFRIGVGLLAVLLGLCIWSQTRMHGVGPPIARQIARAEESAAREDWAEAAQAVAKARSDWDDSRTFLAALADHQPLEDIESLFAALETYQDTRDGTEFRAACRELTRRIQAVEEAHEFSLGSVF